MPRPPAPKVPQQPSGPSRVLIGGVVVVLVAIVAVVVYLATRGDGVTTEAGTGDFTRAENGSANSLSEGRGVLVSEGEGKPQVHVYVDFQCPWCGKLENSSGAAFTEAAESGDIGLVTTVMSFLDGNLRNDSSTRAANAALCADDAGAFSAYQALVFANQPAQEGVGFTDDQLLQFAQEAGIEGDDLETFSSCMAPGEDGELTYGDYVAEMQERSNRDNITGSPRVLIDGEEISEAEMNLLMTDPNSLATVLEAHQ